MSVDYHRHCQATVLPANGTGSGNGLSWNELYAKKDSFPRLSANWISEFGSNTNNITQDLASVLKIINNSLGNYLPLSGGIMTGFLQFGTDASGIRRDSDDKSLTLYGGNGYNKGGTLSVRG